MTEADLRLFPTMFRHDPAYFLRFKLNKYSLRMQDFVAWDGMGGITSLDVMTQIGHKEWSERAREDRMKRSNPRPLWEHIQIRKSVHTVSFSC